MTEIKQRLINQAGINLIKQFEGLQLKAYRDCVNVLTIGYGHTGPDVHEGLSITTQRAIDLLQQDLRSAGYDVQAHVTSVLTDNQYAALVSLVFNVGAGALIGTQLAHHLNAKEWQAAADGILKFDHAGGKQIAGLTRRRQAERALFLKP